MLTPDILERAAERVMPAVENLGLKPGHIHFELVSPDMVQSLAAYGGLPVRYGHWSFGKSRQRLKTAFDFRLTQIYELVINHIPAYAFVDTACSPAQALMIVAHVAAHADFFRHHRAFATLPDDMVSIASRHRRRLEQFRQQYGDVAVETLLDAAHILADFCGDSLAAEPLGERADDVLGIVLRQAPRLADWEREALSIVWQESRYFWPQQLTRVANEGYATFCHREVLRSIALSAAEVWETAHLQAQIVQVVPPQLNPYRLGYLLYREALRQGGWEAVWTARQMYDDAGLVRAFFSDNMAEVAGLALYRERDVRLTPHPLPAPEAKRQLLTDLDRGGLPHVAVEEWNHRELVLRHQHDGRDLDFAELPFALKAVSERLWKGPIALWTMRQGVWHRVRHDGSNWSDEAV